MTNTTTPSLSLLQRYVRVCKIIISAIIDLHSHVLIFSCWHTLANKQAANHIAREFYSSYELVHDFTVHIVADDSQKKIKMILVKAHQMRQ